MRFTVECRIPAETGNRSIPDGTLPAKTRTWIETAKPEAVCFTIKDGQ